MYELLKILFGQTEHQLIENNAEVLYFSKGDQAHYFVLEISFDEFAKLKSIASFREQNDIYKAFKKEFDRIVVKGSSSVEKNSSLIVLVKVDTLEKLDEHKQQILLLEEDELYFKKFVILYSDNALASISESANSIEKLQEKVVNNYRFTEFFNNGYSEELEDYLLMLQLFIKLPMLKLRAGGETFIALDQRIEEALGTDNLKTYQRILESKKELGSFDFESGTEEKLDELLTRLDND